MKETLAEGLLFISALAFLLLIIGFFQPDNSLFWAKGVKTKRKSALINGIAFFVALIFTVALMTGKPDSGRVKKDKGQTADASVIK